MDSPEQWRWIWLAATAVFAIGEMATPGSFFLAPFAAGALVASLLAFAGVSVLVEWIVFIVVSVAMLALLRPLSKRLDRNALDHGVGSRRLIGRQATVLRAIPAGDEIGMVRVDREQWRAQSIDGTTIPAGIAVRIADVQGTRLIVAAVDPTQPTLAPQPDDTATPIQPTPPTQPTDPAEAEPSEATTDPANADPANASGSANADPAQPTGSANADPAQPTGSANITAAQPTGSGGADPAQPTGSADITAAQPTGSGGAEPSGSATATAGAPSASSPSTTPAGAEPAEPTAAQPTADPPAAASPSRDPAGAEPGGPSGADGAGGAGPANGSDEGEPVEPSAEPVEPPASGDGRSAS